MKRISLLTVSFFAFFYINSSTAQWIQQTSGTTSNLNSIHCIDADSCYCAGNSTAIRKTVNGGTNWTPVTTPGFTNKASVKIYSKNKILIGQVNGTFLRTVDGTVWTNPAGNTSHTIYDIFFHNDSNIIAVGGSPSNQASGGHVIIKSANAGASWTSQNISGVPTLFGIHCFDDMTFVAAAGAETVYKTTDGGANWIVKKSGTTASLYDVHFPTSTVGYAVGGSPSAPSTGGVAFKTTDAGETWAPLTLSLPNTLYGVHFVNADTGYVVGDGGKIQITQNGGAAWSAQYSPVSTALNKIYFTNKATGYIAGANGVILKTTNGGYVTPLVANAGTDASICEGTCVTLGGSSAATGGIMPYTYMWAPESETSNSVVVCPTTTTTYTLTVTDAGSSAATDYIIVTVFSTPTLSISGLANAYCNKSTSVSLTGNPLGGTFSGPGVSGGNLFTPTLAGAGTHTITYTFTDTNGCVHADKQTTAVLPLPAPVPICLVTVDSNQNSTRNYVVWEKPAVTNIDSFRVYRRISSIMTSLATLDYNDPSMFIDSASGVSPKNTAHDYAISVIDTCGIEGPKSDSITTILLEAPVINPPDSFTLTWTDYKGFAVSDYEVWRDTNGTGNWTKIGTVAFSAPNTYTDSPAPSLNSLYRIRASAPDSCVVNGSTVFKHTLSNITDQYISVSETLLNNMLNIFPNPSKGIFRVELSGHTYRVSQIKIYNMLGDLIHASFQKSNSVDVVIPNMAPGVYHLEVITDKGTANKKIAVK